MIEAITIRLWVARLAVTCLTFSAAAVADEPVRRGGTLNMVAPYGASVSSLDPHSTARTQDEVISQALHRTLYRWNSATNTPELELANSVEVSDDGLTYTYDLLTNAYFHNGRQMTADDIIWSYTRVMDSTRGYPGAGNVRIIAGAVEYESGNADQISGLEKIDDFTLRMTISDRVDPAYYLFDGTTSILPREEVENEAAFLQHPVGLGPFKFVEYVTGSRLVAERFDRYYKPGLPYVDRVVYFIMGEPPARDLAFRAHQIDFNLLNAPQYRVYTRDPRLRDHVIEVAEAYTRHIGFSPEFEPFQDPRVRRAFNHAIDSDLIVQRFIKGKAYTASSWLPPGTLGFDEDLEPYTYDPEKARRLLAEAGYPDGFEVEIVTTTSSSFGRPVLEVAMTFLARVGIRVVPKVVDSAVFQQLVYQQGAFDGYIMSLNSGPDSLARMRCFHSSTPHRACNYIDYANPEFDEIIDAAMAATSSDERASHLRRANALFLEDAPIWFFNYSKAVMAFQPWVHGAQANAVDLALQDPEAMWISAESPRADLK